MHKPYEFLEGIEDHLHKYRPFSVRSEEQAAKEEKLKGKTKGEKGSTKDKDNVEDGTTLQEEVPSNALDPVREKKLRDILVIGEREKAAERTFEMGICHLMGLGVQKCRVRNQNDCHCSQTRLQERTSAFIYPSCKLWSGNNHS